MPPKPVPTTKAGGRPVGPGSGRGGRGGQATAATRGAKQSRPRGAAAGSGGGVGKKSTVTAGRGRGSIPAQRGGKAVVPAKKEEGKVATKKPVWTKEDAMARKIQTCFRAYRSRKLLLDLRKKRLEYDQLMDKLQREAYVQLVRMEQERAEKVRQREEEERRKRREQAHRVKRMLEAAFDGDTQEIHTLLEEVSSLYAESGDAVVARYQYKLVECTDANNNTPLSEAGAGGDPNTISLLVSLGANPNSKGQYGRTPLYRAAFAGHLEAVKILLAIGSDPRITADDGATPEQVAGQPTVEEHLKSWDVSETEKLLVDIEKGRQRRLEQEAKLKLAVEDKIGLEIQDAEKDHSARQKQLNKAYEELNKRIYEHDKSPNKMPEVTLQAIHDAEEFLEESKLLAQNAKEKLQQAKLKLRLKKQEYQDVGAEEEGEEEKVDVVIPVKDLDDVLMKDVGDKIAASGKWPLILDPSHQAATFLRYRDTNYLNACSPRHMEPETIRMALLGAIRYGKFAVLDLLDIEDMWPAVCRKFDDVQKDLLPDLVSGKLLKEEKYLLLIRPSDGKEYSAKMFLSSRTHNFKLVIVTQLDSPPAEIQDQCYVIRICIPELST